MIKVQGWVEKGNIRVSMGGLTSTTKVQGSFPGATVLVTLNGSGTHAVIYSDDNGTPLANPFTANVDGSFGFYTTDVHLDLTFSGGGLSAPFTLFDIIASGNIQSYGFLATDYPGVKADGSDITTAVNALAAAGYSHLHWPAGTYRFQTPVWMSTLHLFTGDGAGTIFKPINALTNDNFLYFHNLTNFTARDFSVDVSITDYPVAVAIKLDGVTNGDISNIVIPHGGAIGVHFVACVDSKARNITVQDYTVIGMYGTGAGSLRTQFTGCEVSGLHGTASGIEIRDGVDQQVFDSFVQQAYGFSFSAGFGASRPRFERCTATLNRSTGLGLEGFQITDCDDASIIDPYVIGGPDSKDLGISVASVSSHSNRFHIRGGFIYRSGKSGIAVVDNCSNGIISDVTILDCNQLADPTDGSGVEFSGASCTQNSLHDCQIIDTEGHHNYGVQDSSNGTNYIHSNNIVGFLTAAIYRLPGNGIHVDQWLPYTPSVSSSSGTITTGAATGKYQITGKTCYFYINILITTNGSGSGHVNASLPFTATVDGSGVAGTASGTAIAVSGKQLYGVIGATAVSISNYDASYPGANGERMVVSGSYEIV